MDALLSPARLHILDVVDGLSVPPPARVWQLTPRHSLITSPDAVPYEASWAVTDVSSVYSAVRVWGTRAKEVLQKLTTLNVNEHAMPAGTARQARLAHVNAIILRDQDGFITLSTRDVAQYVWEALLHAFGQSAGGQGAGGHA